MPELPDLQVFSHTLHRALAGKKLRSLKVVNGKKLKTSTKDLEKALEHAVVEKVYRYGKELHFAFKNGTVLGLHLMLRGKLVWFTEKNEEKYTILEFLFEDGKGLALTDFQGQATPTLNPEEKKAPDALEVSVDYLESKLQKSKASIKSFLLDQKQILGIGNAYADEILWEAKIMPMSIGSKIPKGEIKALHKAIIVVLKDAEKQIKATHPDLIGGEIRDFLKIHHHKKKTSPSGAEILQSNAGSRKTYYTKEQELYD